MLQSVEFEYVRDHRKFADHVDLYERQSKLFLDIGVGRWNTGSPIVSLLQDVSVSFTRPLQQILGEDAFGADAETVTSMVLRWLPNTELVGIEAVESRDWQSDEDE